MDVCNVESEVVTKFCSGEASEKLEAGAAAADDVGVVDTSIGCEDDAERNDEDDACSTGTRDDDDAIDGDDDVDDADDIDEVDDDDEVDNDDEDDDDAV